MTSDHHVKRKPAGSVEGRKLEGTLNTSKAHGSKLKAIAIDPKNSVEK